MMDDNKMKEYLKSLEQSLKYLTQSEKSDIINEVRSHIIETQVRQELDMNAILENLGSPKELGATYARKTIAYTNKFNTINLMRTLIYYGSFGINSMILAVLTVSLYICTFLSLFTGFVKTGGRLLGFQMNSITFTFGSFRVPDLLALPLSIPIAVLFYYCSKKLWKVFKSYLANSIDNETI